MTAKVILATITFCLSVVAITISIVFHKRNSSYIKERQNRLNNVSSNLDKIQESLNELEEIECLFSNAHNLDEREEAESRLKKLHESLVKRAVKSNSRNGDTYNGNNNTSNRNAK